MVKYTWIRLVAAATGVLAIGGQAWGSAFGLLEQNASGVGRAFAGTAAVADDASTIYFNPAGLTKLNAREVMASVADINISTDFHNVGSLAALGQPLGADGGGASSTTPVPSLYVSWPLSDRLFAGIGVNAPFGLKTDYNSNWIGRFQAERSEVKTVNVNPTLAWKLNDAWSFGIGADYQHINAELGSAVNYTAVIAQANPALVPTNLGLQGQTRVKGSDSAWGFNLGLLYQPSDMTRIGLNYRSAIRYTVNGDVQFTAPATASAGGTAVIGAVSSPGGPLSNGGVSLDLKVPQSATFSIVHEVDPNISIMADVAWTAWSSIPQLAVVRSSGATLSVTPEKWTDTWRFAAGADIKVNPRWVVRAGVAEDQAPVPENTRTARLPDNDRTWLTFGASWAATPGFKIDMGYAHLLVRDADLNQNQGSTAAYGLVNGTQRTAIDIFALQAVFKF